MAATLATTLAALLTTLVVAPSATAAGAGGVSVGPVRSGVVQAANAANPDPRGAQAGRRALKRAASLLSDEVPAGRGRLGSEATMVLRALRLSYEDLSPVEKKQAADLLARPVRASRLCDGQVCVHFATQGEDRTTRTWAVQTLRTMNAIWNHQTDVLGYRAPAFDQNSGGTARFDVYLENLLDNGLYGYCAPEGNVPGQQFRAYGYCVLDNDYENYPRAPQATLRVTGAHELFHAIQFNYDVAEDAWVMETTATWMEERYADDVNDNRLYLPASQLRNPWRPIDLSDDPQASPAWYGNWIFFQRFSQRFGVRAVRRVWNWLDATSGRPDLYSIQGVKRVLASRGATLPRFYADFAAGNAFPARVYEEGSAPAYRPAPIASQHHLGAAARTATGTPLLRHLANQNRSFVPTSTLSGRWRLRLQVNGPWASSGPGAFVSVAYRNGGLVRHPVPLDGFGDGALTVNFTRAEVARVVLTVANAGTQYRCWQEFGNASCHGVSQNDGKAFRYTATAVR